MVYGCGSFIITFEESVVNFSLQDSNMKGGSGNVEERENIRERLDSPIRVSESNPAASGRRYEEAVQRAEEG